MSKDDHKKILNVFGSAFYRAVLLGHDTRRYLSGELIVSGVKNDNIHISFERSGQITVDDHENAVIFINSQNQPADPSGGLTVGEFNFAQVAVCIPEQLRIPGFAAMTDERKEALRLEVGAQMAGAFNRYLLRQNGGHGGQTSPCF